MLPADPEEAFKHLEQPSEAVSQKATLFCLQVDHKHNI